MILTDARDALVRYSENPGNRCPYEASMGDNHCATGLRILRQLAKLRDCPCLQLKERLASRRPMMGEEFGPRPRVIRVLKLDFSPGHPLPPAEIHFAEAG